MNTGQKTNWWVDIVLFVGFITTFFLDLTGVVAHQWIGIFSSALATYHLFLHRAWLVAVSKRFFRKTSNQARRYYVLDMLLLLGVLLIGVTGLVISTWLNLSLRNFITWFGIHITFSITTLLILLLKLSLHWRWIVSATRKIWARPVIVSANNLAVQPVKVSPRGIGRREFLQVMGGVGAASFLALTNASKSLVETIDTNEVTAAESAAIQTDLSSTVNNSTQSSSSSSNSSCTVRCNKACSYPGHCHRYVDKNNNNRCDYGECV